MHLPCFLAVPNRTAIISLELLGTTLYVEGPIKPDQSCVIPLPNEPSQNFRVRKCHVLKGVRKWKKICFIQEDYGLETDDIPESEI